METATKSANSRTRKPSFIVFQLMHFNPEPSIENAHVKPRETIPAIDEVFFKDPESGDEYNRVIRYSPGEKSIFLDEQTDKKLEKRVDIAFTNGVKFVHQNEAMLLEYMRKTNMNADIDDNDRMPNATILFQEYKPGIASRRLMEDDMLVLKAKQIAYEHPLEELLPYAMAIGIDTSQEDADIRFSLAMSIEEDPKNNPKAFLEGIHSTDTQRAFHIRKAFDQGILSFTQNKKGVMWTGGNHILNAPKGVDTFNHFVEWTFEPEGERVYTLMRRKMDKVQEEEIVEEIESDKTEETPEKPKKEAKEKEKPAEAENDLPVFDVEKVSTEVLLDKAIEYGIVKKKSDGFLAMKGRNMAKGKDAAIGYLDDKPALKNEIKRALKKKLEA